MVKADEKLFLKELQKRGPGPVTHICESVLNISERLNIPYKRARYICLKWTDKDWFSYGVSWRVGWLESKGFEQC